MFLAVALRGVAWVAKCLLRFQRLPGSCGWKGRALPPSPRRRLCALTLSKVRIYLAMAHARRLPFVESSCPIECLSAPWRQRGKLHASAQLWHYTTRSSRMPFLLNEVVHHVYCYTMCIVFCFVAVVFGCCRRRFVNQGWGEGHPEDRSRGAEQRRQHRGRRAAPPRLRTHAGRPQGHTGTGQAIRWVLGGNGCGAVCLPFWPPGSGHDEDSFRRGKSVHTSCCP